MNQTFKSVINQISGECEILTKDGKVVFAADVKVEQMSVSEVIKEFTEEQKILPKELH